MIDNKMYHDPCMILDKVISNEEMKVHLYYELAKVTPDNPGPPAHPIPDVIHEITERISSSVKRLKRLQHYFPSSPQGTMPLGRADSVKEMSIHHTWLEGIKRVRDIDINQCYLLCRLAMCAPYPHVHKMILDLLMDELHEAMFWDGILTAYSWMPTAYAGPMDYPGPSSPGTGYTSMPGMYSQPEKKDEKK